jgi:hypothetical protein
VPNFHLPHCFLDIPWHFHVVESLSKSLITFSGRQIYVSEIAFLFITTVFEVVAVDSKIHPFMIRRLNQLKALKSTQPWVLGFMEHVVNVGPFDDEVEVLGKGLWIWSAVCSW